MGRAGITQETAVCEEATQGPRKTRVVLYITRQNKTRQADKSKAALRETKSEAGDVHGKASRQPHTQIRTLQKEETQITKGSGTKTYLAHTQEETLFTNDWKQSTRHQIYETASPSFKATIGPVTEKKAFITHNWHQCTDTASRSSSTCCSSKSFT